LLLLQACKGLRNIFGQKIMLVPIKEMTDVLSVESKVIDLSRDTWVRMKIGNYKGDLAKVCFITSVPIHLLVLSFSLLIFRSLILKVVDVDNVRQRVTVKLIPRIDLQALANKLVSFHFHYCPLFG
jgi:transcription elongation factor SPT5